jgi:alpha-aminoadipate carrier protein LysW
VRNLPKVKCNECEGEIEVPEDAMDGEIVSCKDCGKMYEVRIGKGKIELKEAAQPKEDWGE